MKTADTRFSARAAKFRDVEILDSVLTRFNEQGCFQTTIDHVLADVGIGKGTLYRSYESRDDLFRAALRAGIDTLRARCERLWEINRTDPAAGFRATITELVSLNDRRDATSPATLAGLRCCCEWMRKDDADAGNLESVLVPLVRHCQAARLVDAAAGPSLVAAVIMALVNSAALADYFGRESREGAAARPDPPDSNHAADVAAQVVELVQRAFPSVRDLAPRLGRSMT